MLLALEKATDTEIQAFLTKYDVRTVNYIVNIFTHPANN
ncbi:hypothetical protein SPBRAN_2105 [uncultured Candidatus Thioglobus sp.]|nr:hypothetical protein SPBRAN_2105 [uncultured Candidatus Thioglobus sp.]